MSSSTIKMQFRLYSGSPSEMGHANSYQISGSSVARLTSLLFSGSAIKRLKPGLLSQLWVRWWGTSTPFLELYSSKALKVSWLILMVEPCINGVERTANGLPNLLLRVTLGQLLTLIGTQGIFPLLQLQATRRLGFSLNTLSPAAGMNLVDHRSMVTT